MSVHLTTLGGLRVLVDGREAAALPGQRVRCALLVYLAIEQSVTRDHLMGMIWPDKAPDRARHSLSQTLYELRKDLGEDWVDVTGETVRGTDALTTDVDGFLDALDRGEHALAVEAYGGPFLEGVNLATSRAFEGWVDGVRARLARGHRKAAARAVSDQEDQGDLAGALALARAWVEGDPLDDEAQHRLIDLLARSGRRSQALRQYDRYATLLAHELEVEPLDETRELVERIREPGTPQGDAAPSAEAPEPPPPQPPSGPANAPDFPTPTRGPGRVPATEAEADVPSVSSPAAGGDAGPSATPSRGPGETSAAAPPETALDALIRFADELSRRRVNRVAIAYVVVALATLEGADLLLSPLGVPPWVQTALSIVVLLGFPVVLAIAWVFDITPRGLEVTQPAGGEAALATSRLARRALGAIVVLSLAGLTGLWAWQRTVDAPVFDVNRVMVFPLVAPDDPLLQASVGEDVATMIGHALDRIGPLRWIDGWSLLQPTERNDIRQLTSAEARALAASRGCAYFVLGRVVPRGNSDSTTVLLDLWDAAGDSSVAIAQASGPAHETWQTGLRAVNDLLPTIVGGDVPRDFGQEILSRSPAAVASFLLGEQAFRRGRSEPALLHYRAAVAEDSLFVLAAIRGAQAAAWEHDYGAMERLSRRALSSDLDESERHVAIGMIAYSAGQGDSATAAFDRAIAADSANALAWAQKGEVHSHLAPRTPRPDSVAGDAFRRARSIDRQGVNTAFHLLVDALASGALDRAEPLMTEILEASPSQDVRREIELLERCARAPMTVQEWTRAIRGDEPWHGLEAAKQFGRAGRNVRCAEGGFRAILLTRENLLDTDYSAAMLGLQAILLNSGRSREALALLDASTRSLDEVRDLVADPALADAHPGPFTPSDSLFRTLAGTAETPNPLDGAAYSWTLLQAAAGVELGDRADRVVALMEERHGPGLSTRPPGTGVLYRVATFAATRGDTVRARRIVDLLAETVDPTVPGSDRVLRRAVDGHSALARGDTILALERLSSLRTEGAIVDIAWSHTIPMAFERLVEARLYLREETPEARLQALDLASSLDGEPLGYTPYLAESLAIRIEAADALGRSALATALRSRRASLGSATLTGGRD